MRIPLNNQTQELSSQSFAVRGGLIPQASPPPPSCTPDFQEPNNDTDWGPTTASPKASLAGREAQRGQAAAPQVLSCLLA